MRETGGTKGIECELPGTMDARNNATDSRFEIDVDGHKAVADYELEGKTITFTHTGVPKELGGKGVGTALVKAALDHARKNNLRVVPLCSFVAGYIKKNPEYADLVTAPK